MFYRFLVVALLTILSSCSSQTFSAQPNNGQLQLEPINNSGLSNNQNNQTNPTLQDLKDKVGEVTQQNILYNEYP